MPTSFRTYEAQSRLLAAVLASNPSLKLNFKAIAKHYGSDSSQSAIEHRFRPIKKQASIIRQAVSEGRDAKDLASIFALLDKDIAKLYGESTPQGIEFQFRAIKKDAKALRDAVEQGTSPLAIRKNVPASTATTPSARARKLRAQTAAATPSSDASVSVTAPASALPHSSRRPAKRARLDADFASDVENDMLASDVEYEQPELTQSTHLSTPSRRGTATPGGAATGSIGHLPFTPSTTMTAPPTAFFTDNIATPALSTGVSPADNDSLDNHAIFHTALQHQRQQPLSFYQRNSVTIEDDDGNNGGIYGNGSNQNGANHAEHDDDDDDDDDVYIIDTPSKKPKRETLAVSTAAASMPTVTLGMNRLDSWNQNFLASHLPGQSQSQAHFAFDASGSSWDSMGIFSVPTDPIASFAAPASFYDNDDGI
ncbi:hypothetical protein SEPCBS57363_005959 [Sporothrix epigloea]|uniref:Uncharacterized protein n=1 Tax=Sporothrix epigloea TaxID=1892477 RepID=A0ABP0E0F7_9PEZI